MLTRAHKADLRGLVQGNSIGAIMEELANIASDISYDMRQEGDWVSERLFNDIQRVAENGAGEIAGLLMKGLQQ